MVRIAIAYVVYYFAKVLEISIFIRVIISWLPINPPSILCMITDPILGPIRKMLDNSPLGGMMLDFSPIIALLIIELISSTILGIL